MTTTIQINARGTLTLPKPLRRSLGLENGGLVVAEAAAEGVLLKPGVAFPVELYSEERVAEFAGAEAELARHLRRKRK